MMNQNPGVPFTSMPTQTPGNITLTSLPFQQRPMFPPQHRPPNGMMTPVLPPGYRPILIPRPPMQPVMRPDMLPMPMPGFPMMPTGVLSGGMPTPVPQQQSPTLPPRPESEMPALDLSSKKRKSDSSEDEAIFEHRKLIREEALSPPVLRSPTSSESEPVIIPRPVPHSNCQPAGSPDSGLEVESSTDLDIISWDVDHVFKFVCSVPGCQEYAEVSTNVYLQYILKYVQ